MPSPDLASIAKTMREAHIAELTVGKVCIRLHESAFVPAGQPTPDYDKVLPNRMPSDEEMQFWSVEGKAEEPEQ